MGRLFSDLITMDGVNLIPANAKQNVKQYVHKLISAAVLGIKSAVNDAYALNVPKVDWDGLSIEDVSFKKDHAGIDIILLIKISFLGDGWKIGDRVYLEEHNFINKIKSKLIAEAKVEHFHSGVNIIQEDKISKEVLRSITIRIDPVIWIDKDTGALL